MPSPELVQAAINLLNVFSIVIAAIGDTISPAFAQVVIYLLVGFGVVIAAIGGAIKVSNDRSAAQHQENLETWDIREKAMKALFDAQHQQAQQDARSKLQAALKQERTAWDRAWELNLERETGRWKLRFDQQGETILQQGRTIDEQGQRLETQAGKIQTLEQKSQQQQQQNSRLSTALTQAQQQNEKLTGMLTAKDAELAAIRDGLIGDVKAAIVAVVEATKEEMNVAVNAGAGLDVGERLDG